MLDEVVVDRDLEETSARFARWSHVDERLGGLAGDGIRVGRVRSGSRRRDALTPAVTTTAAANFRPKREQRSVLIPAPHRTAEATRWEGADAWNFLDV